MIKIEDVESAEHSQASYGEIIEKVEIIRSMLRWANTLERPQIESILNHCGTLRDEILKLSHTERFLSVATRPKPKKGKQSAAARRAGLVDRNFTFEGVFGESPKVLDAFEIAEKAAPTNLPVLINGESGTGKELMAKVIHANGLRSEEPYVSVNCGAIPENLIESELFGHVKGAFTGASSNRAGRFESAVGGTIFLDEIGELPLTGQVKLLRVLQSSEIQRVGSDEIINVDVRIVAATNRDLKQMCADGQFREDLFYRLSVINVTLPPLRERRDEIELLVEFLVDEAAEQLNRTPIRLSRKLRAFLMRYEFPGNIRELRNLLYRVSCLAGDTADLEHLPEDIRPSTTTASGAIGALAGAVRGEAGEDGKPLEDVSLAAVKKAASDAAEREFLEAGLLETSGNVTGLAETIGMNRTHLQALLKKHDLKSRDFKRRKTTEDVT